jgi:citrate synthase
LAVAAGLALSPENARAAARETTIAAALAAALGASQRRRPALEPAIDAVLVVSADHELNASTFAARIAASTGADLDACMITALSTLSGPKHGGLCDRVESLADETVGPARARAVVERYIARGDALPGFGHALYPEGDPRGRLLTAMALRASPKDHGLSTLVALANAVEKLGGEPPTLDFGLVALRRALGLPRGSATALFAIGRTAGWIAHILEQRRSNVLLRPRAVFAAARGGEDSLR